MTPPLPARARNAGRQAYRYGWLVWAGDRIGTVRADDGDELDVIIPNGLWPPQGVRVALVLYPGQGWVVACLVSESRFPRPGRQAQRAIRR